jgi:single-strand DNA-binding protein
MFNRMTVIGRLGKTPELKTTPSGISVTSFGVATTEKWKDAQGTKKEETQWHNLVLWGKNAEAACKFMKKGEMHFFEGTMKYEKDKDYEENKKTYAKIHVTNFKLLPNGQNAGGHTPEEPGNSAAYSGGRSGDEPDFDSTGSMPSNGNGDDDIPF